MVAKKLSSLDRVLGRVDNLDSVNLANLVKRLARERSLLEAVFNTIREGIVVIDGNGVVQYANGAASGLIGLKESDIGISTLWRLAPDLRECLEGCLDRGSADLPPPEREAQLSYPEVRWVRIYVVPLQEEAEDSDEAPDGLQERYTVILTDITRDKLSTQEAIENEKVSSILLLAAGVAHELGNPLNSLNIHLQLMRRRLAKIEGEDSAAKKTRESVAVCEEEVRRLDSIISHFLQAIRPVPPDFSDVNLIEVLEEVLGFQATELENAGVDVEVAVEENYPLVSADRNQIKQIFFNVIKNARESMSAGGSIRVRAVSDGDFVYLRFGDTGSGITAQDLTRVFRPYYTTKKGGSGLGLMIVQRIMRTHGGRVEIESEPGVGTVLTLRFPQKQRKVRLLHGGAKTGGGEGTA